MRHKCRYTQRKVLLDIYQEGLDFILSFVMYTNILSEYTDFRRRSFILEREQHRE